MSPVMKPLERGLAHQRARLETQHPLQARQRRLERLQTELQPLEVRFPPARHLLMRNHRPRRSTLALQLGCHRNRAGHLLTIPRSPAPHRRWESQTDQNHPTKRRSHEKCPLLALFLQRARAADQPQVPAAAKQRPRGRVALRQNRFAVLESVPARPQVQGLHK